MRKEPNWDLLITLIIFLFIFALRMPYIANSPAEMGDMWRQPDTESIARNFTEQHFNILYPQFNYDGPLPNYIQLEFQVTTFIIAVLYKLFGHSYIIARLVPTVFFMFSALYLYLICRDTYDRQMAWIAVLIYGLIPLNLFYSRAIMPESALLFFFLGSYYHFLRWLDEENTPHLMLSGIYTALAISQKTPAVFIGLAMLGLCLAKYKAAFLKKGVLWAFAAVSLLPPYLYIKWSERVSEFKFVTWIAQKHIFPKVLGSAFSPEAWTFFKDTFPEAFTAAVLTLCVLGLAFLRPKKDAAVLLLTLAVVFEILLIVSVIKFKYYLIFLTPVAALLAGKPLWLATKKHKLGILLAAVFIGYLFYTGTEITKPYYEEIPSITEFAEFIDQHTQEDDLVVIPFLDPARLSLSSRRGWRANIDLYDHIPRDIEGELKFFEESGAKYFIVKDGYIYNDFDGSYLGYLEQNYQKLLFDDGYVMYVLDGTAKAGAQ